MTLRSLEQANAEARAKYDTGPKPNGIACPVCGHELYDSSDEVYMSMPPQKDVVCLRDGCGWHGYRVA